MDDKQRRAMFAKFNNTKHSTEIKILENRGQGHKFTDETIQHIKNMKSDLHTVADIHDFEDYYKNYQKMVMPRPENIAKQKNIADKVTRRVWDEIDRLGIRNKVHDVSMQGSYVKGTDLAGSGSDLDLFVIFKKKIPEKERNELGLMIGMSALAMYNPRPVQAKTKFAEAKFIVDDLPMEVQVIPTRDLSLEEIRNRRESDGTPIDDIGMERTPHQTLFMQQHLGDKRNDVRVLKQFMKDVKVYDSSIKSQGFSGYSAESLIYNLGSFENVLSFFANFEKGVIIGKLDDSKIVKDKFNLADPIDPNRNLIPDTVSDVKIARMIKASRVTLEYSRTPIISKSEPLDTVQIQFQSNEKEDEKLGSQVNSALKKLAEKLTGLGYVVPKQTEQITPDYKVENYRTSYSINNNNKVTMNIGIKNKETASEIIKSRISTNKNLPQNVIDAFIKANHGNGIRVEKTPTELIAITANPYPTIDKAVRSIMVDNLDSSGLPQNIRNDIGSNGVVFNSTMQKNQFENII